MLIKICGMKTEANISAADQLTPDLMGFIFYPGSPRYNRDLIIPEIKASRVGVFVNEDKKNILTEVLNHKLDYLQLHGDEGLDLIAELKGTGIKIIKAERIGSSIDNERLADIAPYCDYFLFDTKGKNYGGNSVKFDWRLLEKYRLDTPFILSGGIEPSDASKIKALDHPAFAGIDVNSRFEISPGIKNIEQLKKFIYEIRN